LRYCCSHCSQFNRGISFNTIVTQILFLLAAAGVVALASNYYFVQAPIGYHAEMLEEAGSVPDDII
jgi:hypothetical protein